MKHSLVFFFALFTLNETTIDKKKIGIYIGEWPYGKEIKAKLIKTIENMDPLSLFDVKLIAKKEMQSTNFAMNSRFYIKMAFIDCERDYNTMRPNFFKSNVHGSVSQLISASICARLFGQNTTIVILPASHFQHNLIQIDIEWLSRYGIPFDSVSFITYATTDMAAFQSMLQLKDTLKATNNRRIMFLLFHIPNASFNKRKQFVQQIFHNVSKVELPEYHFVTYTSFDNAKLLLLEAHRQNYLNFPSMWLININEEKDNKTEEIAEIIRNNITCITVIFPLNHVNNDDYVKHVKNLYNCITDHFASVLEMAGKVVYRSQYQFTVSEEIQNVTKAVTKINCDFKYRWKTKMFAVGVDNRPIQTDVLWQLGTGFTSNNIFYVFSCKSDGYQTLLLRIFTVHDPPWQIVPDPCTNSLKDYHGTSFNLLKTMQRNLRFQYNISCLSSTEKSSLNSTYTLWDLSVKKLLSKEVDLLAYPIVVTEKREKQVHLTPPFHQEAYTILSCKPKELTSFYIFFEPFKYEVWLLIALVVVVFSTSLHFIQITSRSQNINSQETKQYPSKWMDCVLYFYGTLSQQGMTLSSLSVSSRTLVSSWLLSVIIFTAIYSGNLVAFLTIPRFTTQIKNLEDLLNAEGSVSWGIPKTSTIFLTFSENSYHDKMQYIFDHAVIHADINDEILQMVIDGNHVIIDSKTSLLRFLQHHSNIAGRQYFALGDDILFDKISFAMRRNYSLYSKFDAIIEQAVIGGLVEKWKSETFPRIDYTRDTTRTTDAEELSISLSYFQSALYTLGIGCITSILCLLIEVLCVFFYKKMYQ